MSWTHVTITGDVVRAPRRRVDSGRVVARLGLEVLNTIVDAAGKSEAVRSSIEVVCFGHLADHVHTTLRAGMRVVATGLIAVHTWEREGGGKGSRLDLIATDLGVSLRRATAIVTPASDGLAVA